MKLSESTRDNEGQNLIQSVGQKGTQPRPEQSNEIAQQQGSNYMLGPMPPLRRATPATHSTNSTENDILFGQGL